MAKAWFVRKGDTVHGPMQARKLKEWAEIGMLLPTDEVRPEGRESWAKAAVVKGLSFAHSPYPEAQDARPECDVGVTQETPSSISTITSPDPRQALPFSAWYRSQWLCGLSWYFQLFLWLLYGFVWIPIWYFLSATPSGGVRSRWFALPLDGKMVFCLPLLLLPLWLLTHRQNEGSANRSDLAKPVTFSLDHFSENRGSGAGKVFSQIADDSMARREKERRESQQERESQVRFKEEDARQKERLRGEFANAAANLRLERFVDYYTVKNPRQS